MFTLVNGEEGTPVLNRPSGAADFLRIYADPAADGRSHGAGLSDLFWYWLAPGPEVHQEHLEPGPRYEQAARTTRNVLASRTKAQWAELVTRCTARGLDEAARGLGETARGLGETGHPVRLRDLMMPIWAAIYYELVFGEPCPPNARELIVANADDVVSALKCLRLRHMRRRSRLNRYLRGRIDAGTVPFALPPLMSPAEQAFYLQGTFFNTAVVQMSEAMAHLLLAIAQHQPVQARLRDHPDDDGYFGQVIDEALRVWPLFGIAHRITTSDIDVSPPVAAGSVVLFDYPAFHHGSGGDTAGFAPDRWEQSNARTLNFIPFGVSANRPCPARGVAPIGMAAAAREVLRRFVLTSSVAHTRSLPNRAPAFLTPVGGTPPAAYRLALMKLADRWADVGRSVVQLLLGTFMVLDARRQGPCRTYFADHPEHLPAGRARGPAGRARGRSGAQCPVTNQR
jgi:cytochrome P450